MTLKYRFCSQHAPRKGDFGCEECGVKLHKQGLTRPSSPRPSSPIPCVPSRPSSFTPMTMSAEVEMDSSGLVVGAKMGPLFFAWKARRKLVRGENPAERVEVRKLQSGKLELEVTHGAWVAVLIEKEK